MSSIEKRIVGARVDPLLIDEPGHSECLLGNEAVVRGALEAGVGFASGYPGTPSSEVTDAFARIATQCGIAFEYSVNEKIALEVAYAACLSGVRSICAMKHLGLMVAGDPLSTMPYMGVVGGLVIVSAGDPSCHTSPNEQDQRYLGSMLHLPVLDPATPQEAQNLTRMAFDLSEQSKLPVLLRITARVSHTRTAIRYGALAEQRRAKFAAQTRFVPVPHVARKLRQEIHERLAIAGRVMVDAGVFERSGSGRQAILASGSPAALCHDLVAQHGLQDQLVLATLSGPHPLPTEPLLGLLREVDRLLVVEELSPFVEDALRALSVQHGLEGVEILGKRSGHLPIEFEYEPQIVQRGLHRALGLGPQVDDAAELDPPAPPPPRPPVLCPGCPHRSTYFAVASAFPKEQHYFNDIGCYTLGHGAPLDTADALLCMGAGITLATGVARVTAERTVGFVGDSTFFHAGMPALLNAIKERANIVVVILDNQVTAMTGFQQSPGATIEASSPPQRVDIEPIVRALGAEHVERIDPFDLPAAIAALERARDGQGVSVVISEHACPVHESRHSGKLGDEHHTFVVDPDRCQSCGREAVGMRCKQCPSRGLSRHMSRTRALQHGGATERAAVAPCATACPLGLCVQGYAGHIAGGQYDKALELIMSRLPLPDSVCRVCHRPCEAVCVRSELEGPVGINDLKRFVMDWAAGQGAGLYDPPLHPPSGNKVAIIGAGPAGLTAAHDLALRGHVVSLFDAAEEPGGLLRSGIPRYRLPSEALRRDIDRILALGVHFRGGVRLGTDTSLEQLLDEDRYDAVLLAIGAGQALQLDLGDSDGGPELVDALTYLRDPQALSSAERVVVIGGGNAGVDAARTARRCGAEHVTIVCPEPREQMPAIAEELEAALLEQVKLLVETQPTALVSPEEGAARGGLRCASTSGDGSAELSASARGGAQLLLEADRVIIAIGQRPVLGSVEGVALDRDSTGGLKIDPESGQSSHPKIFAAGDLTDTPRKVTDAIASGQRAAWGIDRLLRGAQLADHHKPPSSGTWSVEPQTQAERGALLARVDRTRPAAAQQLGHAQRTAGFDEVIGTLSEEQAQTEANRCVVCGQCGNCRACIDLFGCPAILLDNHQVTIDPQLCSACGVCAAFCPNSAIERVLRSDLGESQ